MLILEKVRCNMTQIYFTGYSGLVTLEFDTRNQAMAWIRENKIPLSLVTIKTI